MKQKNAFLESEGDAWISRKVYAINIRKLPESDLFLEISAICHFYGGRIKVLEIGCGNGHRLKWLQENLGFECYRIDLLPQAI